MKRKGSSKEKDDDKKKSKTSKGAESRSSKKKEVTQVGFCKLDFIANFAIARLLFAPLSSKFSFNRMKLMPQRCQRSLWERPAQSRRRARSLLSQKKAHLCPTLSPLPLPPPPPLL